MTFKVNILKLGMASRYDPWEPPSDPQYVPGVPMVWCTALRVYSTGGSLFPSISTVRLRSVLQALRTILTALRPPATLTVMLIVSSGRCTSVCDPDTSPSSLSIWRSMWVGAL